VWLAGRRLHDALAGDRLTRSDFRVPQLATADLTGRTVTEVVSRGKHLLTRVDDDLTLHTHFRMDGSWHLYRHGDRWRGGPQWQVRVLLETAGWQAVGYRLPVVELLPRDREDDAVGHLGPDILGPDWDPAEAVSRLAAEPDREIGAALLDQRNLAGIGTLWCAEALFLEGVPPWRPVGELDRSVLERVVTRAQRLVDNGRRRAMQSSTGSYRPDDAHYVHARSGRPCRRCGATVRVAPIGEPTRERAMFYCPGCQGGLGPTDDGRPQAPLGSSRGATRSRRPY
jgi:endonuclease VIII